MQSVKVWQSRNDADGGGSQSGGGMYYRNAEGVSTLGRAAEPLSRDPASNQGDACAWRTYMHILQKYMRYFTNTHEFVLLEV